MFGVSKINVGSENTMEIEIQAKAEGANTMNTVMQTEAESENKMDVDLGVREEAKPQAQHGPRRILPVRRSHVRGPALSMRGLSDTLGSMFGLAPVTPSPAFTRPARVQTVCFRNRHNYDRDSRFADRAALPRQYYNWKRTVASLTSTESQYKKRRRNPDEAQNGDRAPSPDLEERLKDATTLYVGNLSFFTTEEQIHELFSKTGEIKRLVMGLDRFTKTPCGFCFVEYYSHADALDCLKYIGGTKLDERIIRTDLDEGFSEGRQYGRGKSGGQVRDEYRQEYDPGRGGFGKGLGDEGYADEYMGGR